MINRIELILKTQNLTPTQFADAIGIQRSSMSHILARRNNPSLDFVMKVLNRFPEINAEWLLTGKNQMLSLGTAHPTPSSAQDPQTSPKIAEFEWDNDQARPAQNVAVDTDFQSVPKNDTTHSSTPAVVVPIINEQEKIPSATKRDSNQNSDIERIIVFFTDGTFKSYVG